MKQTEAAADYRPGAWAVEGEDKTKSPPMEALYPEKDRYLTIAAKRYYDADFMRQEWEGVWTKSWTCAGFAADIPNRGDWFKYDLGHESFIVVRQDDGGIRAFHNVCKHRGRQLVSEDFGRAKNFVCPYHSWSFGRDGTNNRVTSREYFDERSLCGELSLREVRCEQWAGFVFINMDKDAEPLLEYLDALPEVLKAYPFESMYVVKDVSIELPCNWKLAHEAFLEPYHAHVTHPQILPAVDELYNQYDFFRNGHTLVVTPVGLPSPRFNDQQTVNPFLSAMLMEAGIDPETFKGGPHDVRPAIWEAKRSGRCDLGIDYSGYSNSQLTDDWNPSFFPNMTFNAHPEGVMVMRFLPHASDPGRCHYHVTILMPKLREGVRPPAYMGVEDDVDISGAKRPSRRYTTIDDPQLGEVLEQDISNLVLMQRGVMSKAMDEGIRLGELEQRIQLLHAQIDRCIAKAGA